jgi:chemotaxis protein MotB
VNTKRIKYNKEHEFPLPKRHKEPNPYQIQHHDETNWLVSYADMMTLLCGFFIMMFALSTVDQNKFESAKKDLATQFKGKYEKPKVQELANFITQVISDAQLGKLANVKTDATGVSVTFQSTVFFDTLSADVKPEGKVVLDKLIATIANRQQADKKEYRIIIEGHTDSRPILGGTFPTNWELSGARASRVVRMFLDLGFSPQKLAAIGYADTRPEAPSRNPAGEWAEESLSKNRRVVLRILAPEATGVPLAEAVGTATTAH